MAHREHGLDRLSQRNRLYQRHPVENALLIPCKLLFVPAGRKELIEVFDLKDILYGPLLIRRV
jgi:hypothetical protein